MREDLNSSTFADGVWTNAETPLLLALTGDLTQEALATEFGQAATFMSDLLAEDILGVRLGRNDMFVVPGNHDAIFTEPDPGDRWHRFCDFYERHSGHRVVAADAHKLTRIIDRSHDASIIIAEINTCFDVRKNTPDEKRGHVDPAAIRALRDQLSSIPPERRDRSLKIALMHHHPIVLPALAEPDRGYDAVVNAQLLLGLLREHGFHLVLHGHKHYPHTFSYDALCAWTTDPPHPLMIVAGGSVASKELPDGRQPRNTYNLIALKWNPDAKHGRLRVVTRGLETFDAHGNEMDATRWHWTTLRTDDRNISVSSGAPPRGQVRVRPFDPLKDDPSEAARGAEYKRLRGNMLVCEVQPSLDPEQAYEAHVWLVEHKDSRKPPRFTREIPTLVTWSAGRPPNFLNVKECIPGASATFKAHFAYWGPMLVQARLGFQDGSVEGATIYARMPSTA
jgi:3',5'-cyclic AMP phosphodiesterase CpdA